MRRSIIRWAAFGATLGLILTWAGMPLGRVLVIVGACTMVLATIIQYKED